MVALPNPWHDDKLRRKQEAIDLLIFLNGRLEERRSRNSTASYVLNLNSRWGHGKTFFLNRLREDVQFSGAPIALINAWETDFSDDPLTAIMSSIDEALSPFLSRQSVKNAWRAALRSGGTLAISLTKNVGSKLLSRYAGDIADEFYDASFKKTDTPPRGGAQSAAEKDPLGVEKTVEETVGKIADSTLERLMKSFRAQQRSISTFREQLAAVARSLQTDGREGQPIYVLIDELDRCRPTYAIRMLEAVKHLFNTDGVVFIVATDTEQLAESVKAVYGANFDSERYLHRFFDRTYRFRTPDRSDFVKYLFARHNISDAKLASMPGISRETLTLRIFDDFGTSLRDMEQCFDILHTVCTLWDKNIALELGYLLALIILYHGGKMREYSILSGQLNGKLEKPLIDNPTTLISRTEGSGFRSDPARVVTGTTKDLLDAYQRALTKPLPEWAAESLPTNPIAQMVGQRMREEFHTLHGNMSHPGNPPHSVIHEYHKFVELAVRFETEEQAAAREAELAEYARQRG